MFFIVLKSFGTSERHSTASIILADSQASIHSFAKMGKIANTQCIFDGLAVSFAGCESILIAETVDSTTLQTLSVCDFGTAIARMTFAEASMIDTIEEFANIDAIMVSEIEFPKSIITIQEDAFCSNIYLKSVIFLSDGDLTIERGAFKMPNLCCINFSACQSVTLGVEAFANSVNTITNLFALTITESTKVIIGDKCFECLGLTTVTISNVDYLGNYCFRYCKHLEIAAFELTAEMDAVQNGCFYGCIALYDAGSLTNGDNMLVGYESGSFCGTSIATVIFSPTVEYIGNSAFADCSSLTSITFLNDASLGRESLVLCSDAFASSPLVFARLDGVTHIMSNCFFHCSFEYCSMPSIRSIEQYGFNECSFPELIIPTTLENYVGAFLGGRCERLILKYDFSDDPFVSYLVIFTSFADITEMYVMSGYEDSVTDYMQTKYPDIVVRANSNTALVTPDLVRLRLFYVILIVWPFKLAVCYPV